MKKIVLIFGILYTIVLGMVIIVAYPVNMNWKNILVLALIAGVVSVVMLAMAVMISSTRAAGMLKLAMRYVFSYGVAFIFISLVFGVATEIPVVNIIALVVIWSIQLGTGVGIAFLPVSIVGTLYFSRNFANGVGERPSFEQRHCCSLCACLLNFVTFILFSAILFGYKKAGGMNAVNSNLYLVLFHGGATGFKTVVDLFCLVAVYPITYMLFDVFVKDRLATISRQSRHERFQ